MSQVRLWQRFAPFFFSGVPHLLELNQRDAFTAP
jgi:hypothetical protein